MAVGKSIIRKEAWDKVAGRAKYTNDFKEQGMLHAALVTSPYAHARILSLETRRALAAPGVHAVVTGEGLPLTGEDMRDRPPIAFDKVRYYGEVVAVVVADTLVQAEQAARLVRVAYEPLPAVGSPREALKEGAPLLHEHLDRYEKNKTTYPEPGTNVAHRTKIRKGNIEQGFAESDVIVETSVSFAPSDHIAMETRCATAEIWPDGTIHISASSQSPFMIKKLLHTYFGEETGKVIVHTPLVGGAYGGKAPVQLELLAYLASKAVGGRKVSVWNSREHDMVTSPVHIGLEATVKIGATKEGLFKAMEILFLFDGGAYSDKAIDVSRAAAVDCTGPYHVENVFCDSLCVYTFDNEQRVLNPQLRTYRPIRFGEHPEYIVEFVETPQIDAPYGARGIGEHGLIGMPAALANALSLAAGVPLNELPLVPELIWRRQKGGSHGSV